MSSSVSSHAKVPKKRSRVTNSKQGLKSESKQEISKEETENMKKTKLRSSSLSKEEKFQESPLKSRSMDRTISNRYSSQNVSVKKGLSESKKIDIGIKKNLSSTISKNQNANKNKDPKAHSSTSKVTKPSEKVSRLPMKGPSGKTNVEIAKSFIKNATGKKNRKETKSNSSKSSEKLKSNKTVDEETERPRTSTIRKGVAKNDHIFTETSERQIGSEKILGHLELNEKYFDSKSTDENVAKQSYEDDDKQSYENDDKQSYEGDDKQSYEGDDKQSYEEDFEDYDSDFENSGSDSSSVSEASDSVSDDEEEEIVNQNLESVKDNKIQTNHVFRNSANISSQEIFSKEQDDEHAGVKIRNENPFLRMSDRSFLTNKTPSETSVEKKLIKPSHSFINFAYAVEQEKKKKYSNRVLKRASDLLEMITLNEVTFNHIDIPPMKYDTFIRFFGKTDTKQVFVQTENVEDEEIQTDYVERINKWTQIPSYDNFGFGGDTSTNNVMEDVALKSLFHSQDVKLSSFLQNSSKVMLTILKEDYSVSSHVQATKRRNELFYSDGYYSLPPLDFLKDIPVLNVYCSSESSNYVLTIFDGIVKVPQINDERGIICIWNILDSQKPEHILIAHSQPTCATFGPSSNSIVVAGMKILPDRSIVINNWSEVDGSTLLWDLSDNAQGSLDGSLSLKVPTYSTAVVLGKENHHSHVVAIQASFNYSKFDSKSSYFAKRDDSRNFHVLTLEDTGIINIWVVVEVLKPDLSGLETDLGLSPGGKLRLVRSSSIFLYDISALQEIQKINIRTFDFRLVPSDPNRILVTTDVGIILHVNRQGGSANPRFYSGDLEVSSEVRCIDCSPHNEDLFLVGCSDGSAKLYNLKLAHPVLVFPLAAKGDPLTLIQWSPIHPAMFVVLSSSSNFYLWNLMEDSHRPINSYRFLDSKVTWFSFGSSWSPSQSHESHEKNVYMFISQDYGETEVHVFQHGVSKNEYSRQLEYMKSL